MREIPKKNYIFLVILCLVTFFVVTYLVNWYKTSKEFYVETSIMSSFLAEIKETEIENYILENPEGVIYISYNDGKINGKFETKLKEYILKEDIKSEFVYFDCTNLEAVFFNEFQNKYFVNTLKDETISYPNFLIVEEGKIVDMLYGNERELDINDVKSFLEKNGVTKNA